MWRSVHCSSLYALASPPPCLASAFERPSALKGNEGPCTPTEPPRSACESRPKWASARLPEWKGRGPSLSGRGESHFLSKGLSDGVVSNLPSRPEGEVYCAHPDAWTVCKLQSPQKSSQLTCERMWQSGLSVGHLRTAFDEMPASFVRAVTGGASSASARGRRFKPGRHLNSMPPTQTKR